MMLLDFGIETALNAGAPVAAPARDAAGALPAADGGRSGPAEGAAAEGSSSFHALLRAAVGKQNPGKTACGPERPAEDPADPSAAAQNPESADSEGRDLRVSETDAIGLWTRLMQALQALPADAPNRTALPGGSGDAADIPTAAGGISSGIFQFLDKLKKLQQAADGAAADSAASTGRLADLPEEFKALLENAFMRLPPEERDALRRGLHEHLRGLASDGGCDNQGQKAVGAAPTASELDGRYLPASDAHAGGAAGRAGGGSEIPPALRNLRAEIRTGAPAAGDGSAAVAAGDPSAAADGAAAVLKSRTPERDAAPAAALRHESAGGSVAPEAVRPADGVSDGRGKVSDGQPDPPADFGDFRHSTEDFQFLKASAARDAAPEDGTAASDDFALTPREARPSPGTEVGSGRPAEAAAFHRDKYVLAGTVRGGIFDQIIQRAAVQVGNGGGEINIDLKPEFLGRVRMQIMTENQLLSVRILTELPAVRDMIETGLQQLRSELQSHGLQVERLEVAMANDHRRQGWQQAKGAHVWKTDAPAEVAESDRMPAEGRWEPVYYRPRPVGTAAIDMFV
jgi:hypothetical protein